MKKIAFILISLVLTNFLFSQSGSLNLGSETKMTIAGGKVYCTNFKMESGASLIENNNLVFGSGGTTQIKRNITGSGINPSTAIWHYVGSPTLAGTANTFFGGLINWYNEPTQTWVAVTNPATSLTVGKGYSVAMPATGDVLFTGGIPNFGNFQKTGLTFTIGTDPDYIGWHLLGNPYPSALDWDIGNDPSGLNYWNRSNVDATVYTYDNTRPPPYLNQYVFWTTSPTGSYGTMTDGIIPAEQGFMVKVTAGPSTGSITIPQNARVHSSQGFYKATLPDMLYLEIMGNGYGDKMLIHFDQYATDGFDSDFDAYKLFGIGDAPQLYSLLQGIKLAGNVLSAVDKNPVIPVGLKVGATTSYTITAEEIESFAAGTNIYLEDLLIQKTIKLNDKPTYTFNAAKGDAEHRFNLHFNLVGIPEPNPDEKDINIYSSGKIAYVNIPFDISGEITVYNLLGVVINRVPAQGNSLNKINLSSNSGYYIVKVVGNYGACTGKVFIN